MIGLSNCIIGFLNFATLIISLPLIRVGWWLRTDGTAEPLRFLQWPFLILGLLTLVLSLLALFGSCCQVSSFLEIYLFFMFLIMLALFCFMVFGLIVTNKEVGEAISGIGYEDYRVGNYSIWLQDKVGDSKNWGDIVRGLKKAKVCTSMDDVLLTDVYMKSLSSIQFGCCQPPAFCGFIYQNASHWTVPKSGLTWANGDCKTWSNDQESLCYACNSCKAGVLENIKVVWQRFSIYLALLFLFLNIIYSVSYCALQNNRADRYHRFRPRYY